MVGSDPLRARLEDLGVEVATASDGELRIVAERSESLALLRRLRDEPETAMRQLSVHSARLLSGNWSAECHTLNSI